MEERGAEVTWTGNEIRDGTVYANATVCYNGKTYTISGTLVDGRMVMDDVDLNSIFGWDTTIYYFYGKDQTIHSKNNIADLRKHGYAVIGTYVKNGSDFKQAYNAMPATIDVVIINLHGDPKNISDINISDLDMSKNIDTMVLLSCNAGHLWTGEDSIALQIANASGGNIRQLIAADGTHLRSSTWNSKTGITVKGDNHWKDNVAEANIKCASSFGFICYQWNGTSYDLRCIGRSFTSVRKLLKKVGAL